MASALSLASESAVLLARLRSSAEAGEVDVSVQRAGEAAAAGSNDLGGTLDSTGSLDDVVADLAKRASRTKDRHRACTSR